MDMYVYNSGFPNVHINNYLQAPLNTLKGLQQISGHLNVKVVASRERIKTE
jgi:hypothetical protein